MLLECQDRSQLAALLGVKSSTLTYYAYGKGRQYREFNISKKSGKKRIIHAPNAGLNNIQKNLAKELNKIYKGHPAAHGFIKTRSIVSNASPHVNKKNVLNIDLQDFFPTITSTRIIGLLKSKHFGLGNEVASAIASLCTYEDKLPQGAATSPVLSNMICYRLDRELTSLSKNERVTYTRYADDMTFSTTSNEFSDTYIKSINGVDIALGKRLNAVIENNYFTVNQTKVRLHAGTKGKYVTGIKVNFKPNLSHSFIREVRSMIHSWEHFELSGAEKAFKEKYDGGNRSFLNVLLGKLSHIRQVKGQDDIVYRKLHNRVKILLGKYDEILPVTAIEDLFNRIFVIKSGANFGTGFILDGKWLITCAHVISTDEVSFFKHDKARLPSEYHTTKKSTKWISHIKEFDIAALPLESGVATELNSLSSAPDSDDVKAGDECRVLGYAEYFLGATPAIVDLKVIKVEKNKYGVYDAFTDRTLVSGNSGGPVLNSNNQVIGIVRTGSPDFNEGSSVRSTFLPIQEIRRCLSNFTLDDSDLTDQATVV